jgi:hypothetical protein
MQQLAIANDSAFARHEDWIDAIVDNYVHMSEDAQGKFACLLLPNRFQIYASDYHDVGFATLEEMLHRRGIRVLNLVAYHRAHNRDSISLPDTHLNSHGHGLIADTLFSYLYLGSSEPLMCLGCRLTTDRVFQK